MTTDKVKVIYTLDGTPFDDYLSIETNPMFIAAALCSKRTKGHSAPSTGEGE